MTNGRRSNRLDYSKIQRKPAEIERQVYDRDTVLDFGKHRGKTVGEVLAEDARWLIWAAENVERMELDDEVLGEALIEKQHQQSIKDERERWL